MGEYHFGLGPGHLPKRANAIAEKHGAWLVNYTEPRGQRRRRGTFARRRLPHGGAPLKHVAREVT